MHKPCAVTLAKSSSSASHYYQKHCDEESAHELPVLSSRPTPARTQLFRPQSHFTQLSSCRVIGAEFRPSSLATHPTTVHPYSPTQEALPVLGR